MDESKFQPGDRVVYVGDNDVIPWSTRRDEKTPATVREVMYGGANYQVEFEDTRSYVRDGIGFAGDSSLEHLFEVDQIVTGTPLFPVGDEETITGTVINPDTTSSDGTRIMTIKASGKMRYILRGGAEPVRVPKLNQEEETMIPDDTTPELIGHAPKPVPGPQFVLPFKADQDSVTDANGRTFAATCYGATFADDKRAAEIVTDALNVKFGMGDSVVPEKEAPAPLRTLFTKGPDGRVTHSGLYPFVYEVAPGRFWGANSRAEAMRETAGRTGGWTADEYDNLYDVEHPNGPKVVSY